MYNVALCKCWGYVKGQRKIEHSKESVEKRIDFRQGYAAIQATQKNHLICNVFKNCTGTRDERGLLVPSHIRFRFSKSGSYTSRDPLIAMHSHINQYNTPKWTDTWHIDSINKACHIRLTVLYSYVWIPYVLCVLIRNVGMDACVCFYRFE